MQLAVEALGEFEAVSLSASLRRTSRIARLLGDADTALLLRSELGMGGGSGWLRLVDARKLFPDGTVDDVYSAAASVTEAWIEDRRPRVPAGQVHLLPEGSILGGSVDSLEADVRTMQDQATTRTGLEQAQFYAAIGFRNEVLDRIRTRTHAYLCQVEVELSLTVATQRIFDHHRQRVDLFLRQHASTVFDQFAAAYRRVQEGAVEERAQALTSCRRILKSVADVVYPVPAEPVPDNDGKIRDLSSEKYINRLWQFIDQAQVGGTFTQSIHATLIDLGNRIDALYQLCNKGTHADQVSVREVEWCVIQTYLLSGEMLSLQAI